MIRTILAMAALAVSLSPLMAFAAQSSANTVVWRSGPLPETGRVVIRSGMAWLDETAPIFQRLAAVLKKELTAKGLIIVERPPSKLEAMPKTPLPPSGGRIKTADTPTLSERNKAQSGSAAAQKANELGKAGKLPQLKLEGYSAPKKDADLPATVLAVAPPDVARALFARSQQQGLPEVRSFNIPGRIPEEVNDDATVADYTLVVRFAAVRGWSAAPERLFPGGPPGVSVAATTVRGVGSLGYGAPAAPAPPGRNTYGTPGGYVRGYEGSAPNDFWHRDSDFNQRDYQFKYGQQPNYATPPSGLSPGRNVSPGVGAMPVGRGGTVAFSEWHMLILELYPLAPLREGKKAEPVWRGMARRPGDTKALGKSLPEMAQLLTAAGETPR